MFLSTSELEAGIDHIRLAPRDSGVVRKLVCRPATGERRELGPKGLDIERWHGSSETVLSPDGTGYVAAAISVP